MSEVLCGFGLNYFGGRSEGTGLTFQMMHFSGSQSYFGFCHASRYQGEPRVVCGSRKGIIVSDNSATLKKIFFDYFAKQARDSAICAA